MERLLLGQSSCVSHIASTLRCAIAGIPGQGDIGLRAFSAGFFSRVHKSVWFVHRSKQLIAAPPNPKENVTFTYTFTLSFTLCVYFYHLLSFTLCVLHSPRCINYQHLDTIGSWLRFPTCRSSHHLFPPRGVAAAPYSEVPGARCSALDQTTSTSKDHTITSTNSTIN